MPTSEAKHAIHDPWSKDGNLDGSLIVGVESVERGMHREINAPHLLIMLILPRTTPN